MTKVLIMKEERLEALLKGLTNTSRSLRVNLKTLERHLCQEEGEKLLTGLHDISDLYTEFFYCSPWPTTSAPYVHQ